MFLTSIAGAALVPQQVGYRTSGRLPASVNTGGMVDKLLLSCLPCTDILTSSLSHSKHPQDHYFSSDCVNSESVNRSGMTIDKTAVGFSGL